MSSTPASRPTGEPEPPGDARDPSHEGHDHVQVADCDEAVAELYAFLDGELDDTMLLKVEAHLRRCSPCLEAFDFEADLRRVIAAKCEEQVPPDIKARFCGMLRQLSTAGSLGDDAGAGPSVPAPADGS
jgi:anti-sigma factor (TIGR02949 family)